MDSEEKVWAWVLEFSCAQNIPGIIQGNQSFLYFLQLNTYLFIVYDYIIKLKYAN